MASPIRLRLLRVLFVADAVVLLALGSLLVAMPAKVGVAFGFHDIAPAIAYLIGLWGCALISLGFGYACAAGDPARNASWVIAGIVRGALECGFGFVAVNQHLATWNQAAFGTIVAGVIAVSYALLLPRTEAAC